MRTADPPSPEQPWDFSYDLEVFGGLARHRGTQERLQANRKTATFSIPENNLRKAD
jgi:hypothetical protein